MDTLWKFPVRIYDLFNLRKGEERNVILILLFSFFQFFAIALFFVTANAIFLANHSIGELPYVFISTGIALFILSAISHRLEKVFAHKVVILAEAFLLLFLIVLLRLGFITNEIGWLGYALVVSHRVMADFVSDGFNKLALLLFDVRQGKRLFGLISSSEIPANIIGYLAASSLVPFIGAANLLYISGAGFLIALVFLFVIVNGNAVIAQGADKRLIPAQLSTGKRNLVDKLFESRFIFTLSVAVFLSVTAFCLIEFAFLSHVDTQHQDQVEIVKFIAIIFGGGQVVALLVKTFLYSFIHRRYGISASLLVLPFSLGLISVIVVMQDVFSIAPSLLMWTWVVMVLVNETLRASIYSTTFLSLLQPLERDRKLRGQNQIGRIETIAFSFSGVMLLIIYREDGNLLPYALVLLALVIAWIAVIPKINKEYLRALEEVVGKRIVEGGAVELDNPQTLDIIHKKLRSEHPGEVLYAVDLLSKNEDVGHARALGDLLSHPLPEVRQEIYSRIELIKPISLKQPIKERILDEPVPHIKKLAIRAYCFLGEESVVDEVSPLIDADDEEVQAGALVGLIRHGGINGIIVAGQRLMEYINSPNPKYRAFGALIIGEVGIHNFYHPLLRLLNDEVIDVRKEALKASGKVKHPSLLEPMVQALQAPQIFQIAMISLVKTGDDAIDILAQKFWAFENNALVLRRIVIVCGRVGGEKSIRFLKDKLYYHQTMIKNEILYSCAKCSYHPTAGEKEEIVRVIHAELADAAWFLNCLEMISVTNRLLQTSGIVLLIRAIEIEISYVKKRLLYLLSFLYENQDIINIWESLQMRSREKIANALEIIDVLAQKELSSLILPVLENFPLAQQLKILNARYKLPKLGTEDYLLALISGSGCPSVIDWTRAVAAYSVRQVKVPALIDELHYARDNNNKMLAETADFCLTEIESNVEPEETGFINDNKHTITMQLETKLLTIEKVMALKTTEIFHETADDILVDIAHILREVSFQKDQVIVHKNEIGTCMFIIYSGAVKVHNGDHILASMRSPDFFGELSLLDTEPRSASVTALEDSVLLRIDQQAFYEIMADRSEVIREMMRLLCRRLRKQNEEAARLKGLLASYKSGVSSQ